MAVYSLVALLLLGWAMSDVAAQQQQLNLLGVMVDKNTIIDNLTQFYKETCEKNHIVLNRQELVKHTENCVQPHIDQIMSKSKDGTMMQILFAMQQNPISLSQDQRTWIKKQVLVPGCKILPCTSPLKNPLLKGCVAGDDPIAKGVAFADLYQDALCKNEGESLLAIVESGTSDCAEAYLDKVLSCVRKDAKVVLMKDAYLNQTVPETCGTLGKLHNCVIASSVGCGPKISELLKKTFGDVEGWINGACLETETKTESNDSTQQTILSFTFVITAAILSRNI